MQYRSNTAGIKMTTLYLGHAKAAQRDLSLDFVLATPKVSFCFCFLFFLEPFRGGLPDLFQSIVPLHNPSVLEL